MMRQPPRFSQWNSLVLKADFTAVTELAGDDVTHEQVVRLCQRYYWAGTYAKDRDVIEIACGTGSGLGYLSGIARTVAAGDITVDMLRAAKAHYGGRANLLALDATALPFADGSADVILLFEAIYYIAPIETFIAECRRVLRPGGVLLIASANKDLPDFNPSPHSTTYFNPPGFKALLEPAGFSVRCFGGVPLDQPSPAQRLLRLAKRIAVRFDLIPHTMGGKKLLKRLVFGKLESLPAEMAEGTAPYDPPVPISEDVPDRLHKVLFCEAMRGAACDR
jgi:SAM-dependent methyltransferase